MATTQNQVAPILRLPDELLLDIVDQVIESALTKEYRDSLTSAYRVVNVDASLDRYKDQMLAELHRFTACMRLYTIAKDVLCTRKKMRYLDATYFLDRYGQSLFRISGTLGNHRVCYENTNKLTLIIRYQMAPQNGRVIEEPDYLLEVLEGILLKCTALESIDIEVKVRTPTSFQADVERMVGNVTEKLSAKDGRQIFCSVVEHPDGEKHPMLDLN